MFTFEGTFHCSQAAAGVIAPRKRTKFKSPKSANHTNPEWIDAGRLVTWFIGISFPGTSASVAQVGDDLNPLCLIRLVQKETFAHGRTSCAAANSGTERR